MGVKSKQLEVNIFIIAVISLGCDCKEVSYLKQNF
jgi:hypothetical protein